MARVTVWTLFVSAALFAATGEAKAEDSGAAPARGCGADSDGATNCKCGCDDNHCDLCGRHANCRKICRLIKGTKKISKTCYDCKCEDFCIPPPSKLCNVCWVEEKDPCTGCVKSVRKETWQPGECAQVRTKHVLVKREVSKEVPAFKWEVQKVCTACACRCMAEDSKAPAGTIANDTSTGEQGEAAEVVRQASAAELAAAERPDATPAAPSTAMAIKARLLSLLGK